jgi:tripartite-type tricarboxylate transporter receptor subunit TctC
MKRSTFIVCLFPVIFAMGLTAPMIHAQHYPNHPIQLVIIGAPGDASDITARLLIEELNKTLKIQVVPLNKPGAGTILATDFVAKSKKDGYTLLYGANSILYTKAVNPENVPCDQINDLEPLGLHVFYPSVICVQAEAPWKKFSDVVEYSRKNPGKFRCGIMGMGSIKHFQLEIIKSLAGVDITMIPFKGAMPAVTALLGGHIESAFAAVSLVGTHIDSGKLRGILVDQGAPDLPNIPTLNQLGYKRDLSSVWFALFAPVGVPEEVKKVLVSSIEKAIKNPESKAKIEKLGYTVDYKSPAELQKLQIGEYEEARSIAKRVGLSKP